ncbi:Signal transduction histidine kinase [Parafrankia irregularis]|uniref:histidine kinase n=1 Tax=Parafrankia irregularis TaxID=795642 RepID=A0A0S4QT03_9ACTN|nr:histidine kinase [Parafrankia sp. CH37]CUU57976.1 Signal transduction histidine kinase [Parafrankia irregularis]
MIELRPWHWVALDAVAIVLLAVIAADGDHEPALIPALLLVTAPILLRRRYPVPVLIWTNAVTYLYVLELDTTMQAAAWMLASYSAAVRSRRAAVVTGFATWLLAQAIVLTQDGMTPLQLVAVPLIVAVPPCVLAETVRQRRVWMTAFAEQQRRRAEAEAEGRLVAERLTIARELHDVVAHGVTLMTVQAGIARLRSAPDDPLHEVMNTIEQTGRLSLEEMRRLMSVLRGDDTDGLAPQPGLADLGDLVAAASAAGLRTELMIHGSPVALAAGADVAAYRIVQEALTNAVKHAATRSATVEIAHEADGVRMRVTNPGPAAADGAGAEGQGIPGMRDRAHLHGGTLTARPEPQDTWRVEAWLPYPAVPGGSRR